MRLYKSMCAYYDEYGMVKSISKQCIYQDEHGTINTVFMIMQCLHEKLLHQTVNILPVFCDFMCFFSCSDCRLIETLGYGEFIVIVYF